MVGGIRDAVLFREWKLLMGFVAIFASALVMNFILGAVTGTPFFNPGFAGQPVAHTDGLREWKLLMGFVAIFASALVMNFILGAVTGTPFFNPGFAGQPVAHTDGLWNALGMLLAGFGCVLLGGCPLRQLVLSGEGNTDSAITVVGLMIGAAVAHNFGLASSGEGPTANGKIAVIIGIVVVTVIAFMNSRKKAD